MANYVRRTAVFNPDSERELRIWNWAKEKTNDFNNQNFAAFVRDKLEWCMNNEGKDFMSIKKKLSNNNEEKSKLDWSQLI